MREQNIKQKPFTGFAGYGGGLAQGSGPSEAIIIMENRPSPQGGGPGPITNTQFDVTANTNITITGGNASVRIRCYGAKNPNNPPSPSYGRGYYVDGWIYMAKGQTYHLYKDGAYAAVFYGSNATTAPVCIMLGAEGGNKGTGPSPGPGGNAGFPSGTAGGSTGSQGGGGGTTYGYLSGSGGYGGSAGGSPGLPQSGKYGSSGGLFYPGPGGQSGIADGYGGNGGMGYYGGGGGGGGWQYGPGPQGSGGGGGSCYLGGLPPAAPYPVPVTMASHGPTTGGSRIEFVSFVPA